MNIEYDERERVKSVDGFHIMSDKHAYKCKICGAIWQSKNIYNRSLFRTDDPRCEECDDMGGSGELTHPREELEQVCKCDPIV